MGTNVLNHDQKKEPFELGPVAQQGFDFAPPIPTQVIDLECDRDVVAALRAVDWNFSSSKTDYFAHGLHPYPAKFIPQIPNKIVSLLSRSGDLVWDPFGGSGTTALEALLLGRRAVSTDINPIAEVVGRAKTTTLTAEIEAELTDLVRDLRLLCASKRRALEFWSDFQPASALVPDIPNISKWFSAQAVKELAYLKSRVDGLGFAESKHVALACFSKEVFAASNQDGETRYAAVEKYRDQGDIVTSFARSLLTMLEGLREQAAHLQFSKATFATADVRSTDVLDKYSSPVQTCTVDLVVTSPPYPNATDYHLYHRFRIYWLGFDPRAVGSAEIGSHLRHQKQGTAFASYVDEMSAVLRNIYQALRPGGLAAFVVGDALFEKKIYATAEALSNVAETVGFTVLAQIDRELPENKRSFIRAARRLRKEQLLILRKPGASTKLLLKAPGYRLQPYEEELRKAEILALLGRSKNTRGSLICSVHSSKRRNARRLAFTSEFSIDEGGLERTWQAMLENGDMPQDRAEARKDPKYVTHGIHPYKGKFYPQLAKALLNCSGLRPGGMVLDPFCGSGTVLLEASLSGWNALGFDVNPVAVAIANAKVGILKEDHVFRDHLLAAFNRRMLLLSEAKMGVIRAAQFPPKVNDEVRSWFSDPVAAKMARVLEEITSVPDPLTREVLTVIVSSIVREVSHQDPRDLRIRRRAKPLQDAPIFVLVGKKVEEVRRKLRHFASVARYAPAELGSAKAMLADSAAANIAEHSALCANSVDLVITSPPYATALPYIDTDRLSLLMCHGLDSSERRAIEQRLIGTREITGRVRAELDQRIEEFDFNSLHSEVAAETIKNIYRRNKSSDVGFRRRNMGALLLLYFEKMGHSIENITRCVKPGGHAFVVIGDTRTIAGGKEVPIRSGKVIQDQFNALGWRTKKVLPITVTRENVVHSKNTITDNEIYWFEKR